MFAWRGFNVSSSAWWVALHCCCFGIGCGQVSYRGGGIVLHNVQRTDAGVRDAQSTTADATTANGDGSALSSGSCGNALESEAFRLTNVARTAAGLSALRCDLTLVTTARAHSLDMCARRFFDHVNPDGLQPDERMVRAGVRSPGAENIALGHGSAANVVGHWMQSSGHRRNIMDPRFRSLGIGHAPCVNTAPGNLWSQNFAY